MDYYMKIDRNTWTHTMYCNLYSTIKSNFGLDQFIIYNEKGIEMKTIDDIRNEYELNVDDNSNAIHVKITHKNENTEEAKLSATSQSDESKWYVLINNFHVFFCVIANISLW